MSWLRFAASSLSDDDDDDDDDDSLIVPVAVFDSSLNSAVASAGSWRPLIGGIMDLAASAAVDAAADDEIWRKLLFLG